ncbi:MAG TPA: aldehyde dehydrogenase family protein [Vicinamibacteria bacterium]|nr:aldehyde dehydrogenase family protein [Vicinamibacteria bacterium]
MLSPAEPLDLAFPTAAEIPEPFRHLPDESGLTLLIDGSLSRWSGPRVAIRSAVCLRDAGGLLTQMDLGPAPLTGAAEGLAALTSAARAWAGGRGDWPRASVEERIACVLDFVERALPLRERVSRALMWEVGKPYADCLTEFDRTLQYIRDTALTLRQLECDNGPTVSASGFAARVRRAPLGVALCLGPYNYAVNEVYTLVIPALIMGNPVVMKTPRYGVLANALLTPALAASFPRGVVNVVSGPGPALVGPMMESGLVDVLALVGSARTAKTLQSQHPHPYRLRWVLGLGAKNPGIVLEDADLDRAASEIVSGALAFNGQRCTAIKHVLVARKVAEPLVERLAARVGQLKVGMPWEDGVAITPMPDPDHPRFLEGLVKDAVARGARVVNPGGGDWCGTLFRPALVFPVPPEAELAHREQFGPVVPVSVFDDPEEVLAAMAASDLGQQASVFGRDPVAMGRLVDHLANLVCRVNLNTQCRRGPDVLPFTGRKGSALGTLSVYDALRTFSVRSLVAVTAQDRELLSTLGKRSVFLAPPGR